MSCTWLITFEERSGVATCAGNIIRTAFTGNSASQKGGALFGTTSTGNIMNSTFTSNKAVQSGGAVFQNDCASSISYSIFSKNDGGSGGGGGLPFFPLLCF